MRSFSEHQRWIKSDGREGKRAQLLPDFFHTYDNRKIALNAPDIREVICNDFDLRRIEISNANMEKCKFQNSNFGEAKLSYVRLQDVDFSNCVFDGAHLGDISFEGSSIIGVNFSRCEITRCKFIGVDLRDVQFRGASIKDSVFDGIDLSGQDLSDTTFSDCIFSKSKMSGSKFNHCNFRATTFERVDLGGSIFSNSTFTSAKLSDSELGDSILDSANMQGAHLKDCRLENTSIKNANLQNSTFSNCVLNGATFNFSDLREVVWQGSRPGKWSGQGINGSDQPEDERWKIFTFSVAKMSQIVIDRNSVKSIEELRDHIDRPTFSIEEIGFIARKPAFQSEEYFGSDPGYAKIVREIEFPPEHKQAGLHILSYFHEILSKKYPDIPVKFSIGQEAETIRMTIETPEGTKELIEKTLEDYGEVVNNRKTPEEFLSNPKDVLELRLQLNSAFTQIANLKEINNFYKSEIKAKNDFIDRILAITKAREEKPIYITVNTSQIQKVGGGKNVESVTDKLLEEIGKLQDEISSVKTGELQDLKLLLEEMKERNSWAEEGRKVKSYIDELCDPESDLNRKIGLAKKSGRLALMLMKFYNAIAKVYGWQEIEIPSL